MAGYKVPLDNPKPDIETFLKAMKGEEIPNKILMVEYLIDDSIMKEILEGILNREWVDIPTNSEYLGIQPKCIKEDDQIIRAWLDNYITFWHRMGYDFVRFETTLPLPASSQATARKTGCYRNWQVLNRGPITSCEDFEKYPWPAVTDDEFYFHRYISKHLPEGFGFISCHSGGIFEHTSRLMGYKNLCLSLYRKPKLVKAVVNKLGKLIYQYYKKLLEIDNLSAILQGDDFGMSTGTLISPKHIREYFLPWHEKLAHLAHDQGKHYYLHSCGKIDQIMPDLINMVKIDGKHSFQEGVAEVMDYKGRWGDQIAMLGGVDVDKLARLNPEQLRLYIRNIIKKCSINGRFAIGAGNSIPEYIPVENYLTMLDEAMQYTDS